MTTRTGPDMNDSSLLWNELHLVTRELADTKRALADAQSILAGLARKWASVEQVRKRLHELEAVNAA